jgi:hypothetical protein
MTENVPQNTAIVVQRMSMKQHQAPKPEHLPEKAPQAAESLPKFRTEQTHERTYQPRIA